MFSQYSCKNNIENGHVFSAVSFKEEKVKPEKGYCGLYAVLKLV